MSRLAIITSHPIQYNAPLFELLSKRGVIDIRVFYTWGKEVLKDKYDPGFDKVIEWDIPLLKDYSFEFLDNIALEKGSHHFKGIDNPEIIETIKLYNPSAILVYGWAFRSHLTVMRYFKNRIPIFFRGDSTLIDNVGILKGIVKKYILKWVYRKIDYAFYVGKNNFDYFRSFGIKPDRLIYVPHAIDNHRFNCVSAECREMVNDVRKSIYSGNDGFIFLFAGKFEDKKDPLILLEAFTQLQLPKEVQLVLVGNGPLEKNLIENYGANEQIHFMPFQNQLKMPVMYSMADIFILPSKGPGETWGLAVNEAMASGVPVLVSDKCGCANDLVDIGITGDIFDAGNMDDLKNKMLKFYNNRAHLNSMRMASKVKVSNFSFEYSAAKIEESVKLYGLK